VGEYIVLQDLTADDPACLEISADENLTRRNIPPYHLPGFYSAAFDMQRVTQNGWRRARPP
jgi:hypothetical protein